MVDPVVDRSEDVLLAGGDLRPVDTEATEMDLGDRCWCSHNLGLCASRVLAARSPR